MFDSQEGSKSIEDDSQKKMKTIPQSEVENSQMLGSDDFTGEGAKLDIRKVIADGEDDNKADKN